MLLCPLILLPCLLALTALPARAEDAISTDRPDFVDSADVVGPGRVQIEMGFARARGRSAGLATRSDSTPTLLRLGLAEDWELRLETEGRVGERAGSMRQRGWGDSALSVKWHWRDGDETGGRPAMAWIVQADFASGSGAFRGQGTRPSARLALAWELGDGYDLGVMPGLYRERNEAGHAYTGAQLAATLGRAFGEQWHGFVELAGQQLAAARNGGRLISADTGLSYLMDKDWQIDAAVSRTLGAVSAASAPRWQWTAGLSARF